MASRSIVLIDAVRTPFAIYNTVFRNLMAVDLQRHALHALHERTKVNLDDVGHISVGHVLQDWRTSNLAREASITAGFPNHIPGSTVTLACISSVMATCNIVNMIAAGQINVGISGGAETFSDFPIRYNRTVRESIINLQKAKMIDKVKLHANIAYNLYRFEMPGVLEYTTGESMGSSGDRLAAAFGVTREESDEYALRSHTNAQRAQKEGKLKDVEPISVEEGSSKMETIAYDNGIRVSPMNVLAKLKPAFIKPHGTVTAGNASFLSDGASAALLSTEEYALKNGFKPKAFIREIMFQAQDPKDQLLLGPAYVIPRLMDKMKLTFDDIDVIELHEAFAGQVLATLRALDSDWFCKHYMKRSARYGTLPMDKLNLWGGSLSIGHPFGATGVRLLAQAANRLEAENGRFALIAGCAAGGHAVGMLLERYSSKKQVAESTSAPTTKKQVAESTPAPTTTKQVAESTKKQVVEPTSAPTTTTKKK